MDGKQAELFLDKLASEGRIERLSKPSRTKAVIYRNPNGRCLAVIPESGTAKMVFEARPGGQVVDWDVWIRQTDVEDTDQQLASAGLKVKEASTLAEGHQKVIVVPTEGQLIQLLDLYLAPHETGSGQPFERPYIEAAMDAFDRHSQNGDHSDIFGRFDEPSEYWVRSTRERKNRVYPTKPIVGFLIKNTRFSGGWGLKRDAAARLYNAGFIIVDKEDKPVLPPEHYDHLIRDAERIRLCATNYYIEPAREKGQTSVSIRASELALAIGLQNSFPNICQALGSEKLQQLAKVPPPTSTEPNPSSSTIFTFQIGSKKEAVTVTETVTLLPTNLILCGPPGTGKTYHTAWEAVRLCLGDQAAAKLLNDRRTLMEAYRHLLAEGRIAFVTFHQSMAYEEFVEGLRPKTDVAKEGASVGFRLEPVSGIFLRLARKAEASLKDDRSSLQQNVMEQSVPAASSATDEEIAPQLFKIGNWPEVSNGSYRQVAKDVAIALTHEHPEGFSLQQYRAALIKAGEKTGMVPSRGWEVHNMPTWVSHPERRWIVPISEYSETIADDAPFEHDEGGLQGLARRHTFETDRNFVLIIDEINRANISKVFGELITLLEPDKRLGMENEIRVQLPYSKRLFGVPANLHIIGTMNTADRSIALLDTALRRRFAFRELMPDPNVLSADIEGINLRKLLQTINERIEYLFDREHQIGHAYFTHCKTRADIDIVMRNKVIPLLAEYFYEDWSKVAAVLGDAKPGASRFLLREEITAPDGMESDAFAGPRLRWRVKPERDNNGNGGFDFTEFRT